MRFFVTETVMNMIMEASAKIVGENLKALREGMGLTQQHVADYLKVKREMVAYFEGGTRNPTMDQLSKAADLFGVDLYDLMEEKAEARIANTAFAFRANVVEEKQLESIASFRRIVKNYLKMVEVEKRTHE